MQPETLYKGHTIVPFCSEGPRYKSHYKLTPPGGVGSQWTYLTAEYTTEVAGPRGRVGGCEEGRRQACRRWASSSDCVPPGAPSAPRAAAPRHLNPTSGSTKNRVASSTRSEAPCQIIMNPSRR